MLVGAHRAAQRIPLVPALPRCFAVSAGTSAGDDRFAAQTARAVRPAEAECCRGDWEAWRDLMLRVGGSALIPSPSTRTGKRR